jgi:LmbE family N-acetylglucosaminyl deacetylase
MSGRVLVIAPHPDDESLGCGGAVCLHAQRGEPVHVVFLTSGERGIEGVGAREARLIREAEAAEALGVLGVATRDFLRLPDLGVGEALAEGAGPLREVLERQRPDLVYLPHPQEAHPDHQAALPLVRAALALAGGRLPELRGYEVWTPMATHCWPEDVSGVMARKLKAVRCYRSQLKVFAYDRAVRGLNEYRGCLAGRCRYAEVFQYVDPFSAPNGLSPPTEGKP